jgi:hypothetical protein
MSQMDLILLNFLSIIYNIESIVKKTTLKLHKKYLVNDNKVTMFNDEEGEY